MASKDYEKGVYLYNGQYYYDSPSFSGTYRSLNPGKSTGRMISSGKIPTLGELTPEKFKAEPASKSEIEAYNQEIYNKQVAELSKQLQERKITPEQANEAARKAEYKAEDDVDDYWDTRREDRAAQERRGLQRAQREEQEMQRLANRDPEAADREMDRRGYTNSPNSSIQKTGSQQASMAQSGYMGPSIVDYLKSVGQASDFQTRTRLANDYNIPNYTGTASQNTALLNMLRSAPPPQVQQNLQVQQPKENKRKPEQALAEYGYSISPTAAESFQIAPAKSFKEVYDGLYESLGLDDVRRNIERTTKAVNKLDQELADKIADVNEDPWLTEGVRRTKVQQLQDRYELKRAPYASNLTTFNDLYTSGRDEARYVAEQTLRQYNTEREFQMDQINMWMEEQEELRKAQETQSSDYKSVQGGLYNVKTGEWVVPPAPRSVGGGLYDVEEDEFIVQPKTSTSSGSKSTQSDRNISSYSSAGQQLESARGSDGYTDPNLYARLRNSAPSASEFDKRFGYLVNPLSRERLGLKQATNSKSKVENPFN